MGTTNIKHTFVSGKSDGGDTTKVRPSNWNDEHDIDGALQMAEISSPSTPSSGQSLLYPKSDGRWYSKGDDGVEHGPFSSGGVAGSDYIAEVSGDADLVQYWPLNEAANATSFADVLGGTALTNVLGQPPSGGPPLQRDFENGGSVGIRGGVHVLGRSAITWPSAWTIEAWIFMIGQIADQSIIGQWNGAGAMIYMHTGNDIRIYSGATFATWASTEADVRGLHHIAITHDGTTERLIWDGVEKVNQTIGAPGTNVGGAFEAGRYSVSSPATTDYLISDIAIYDVAKSEAYLLGHYELGMGI